MKDLIFKELKLATPLLTFLFLGFTLMTFIPGYPILCGAFFVCFGIFQSYQLGREDNDILYTALLPIKKTDAVKAKFVWAVILQTAAFAAFALFTYIRMAFLSEAVVYETNALMGANPVFLAFVLIIFAAFNCVFIKGFFKTAYRFGTPFLWFAVLTFVIIVTAETLHYLPNLEWLNTLGFNDFGKQLAVLLAAAILYVVLTAVSCKISQNRFEKIDL